MAMTVYQVEIQGSFFNDAGWDYDPVRLPPVFQTKSKAWEYAEKVQDGRIEVEQWDRVQDPDNTVTVVDVEIE